MNCCQLVVPFGERETVYDVAPVTVAQLKSIVEPSTRIHQDGGRIDSTCEILGRLQVPGDNRIGVSRTKAADVVYRRFCIGHNFHRQD